MHVWVEGTAGALEGVERGEMAGWTWTTVNILETRNPRWRDAASRDGGA